MHITIIGCGWLGLPLGEKLFSNKNTVFGSSLSKDRMGQIQEKGINSFYYKLEENTPIDQKIVHETDVLILSIPPLRLENRKQLYGDLLAGCVSQFNEEVKVIFTSSTSIYPRMSAEYSEGFEFLENEKKSELYHAEESLRKCCGERLTIFRLGGLFGPKRHPVLHLAGKTKVTNPYGYVNLVHQEDVNHAILKVINGENYGSTYNLVYPEYPYRKEYYTKLYRQYNLAPIQFIENKEFLERKIISEKAERELKMEFKHSIFDVIDCFH